MEGVDPKHAKEVERLLRKLARRRKLAVLSIPGLLGLALLLYNVPHVVSLFWVTALGAALLQPLAIPPLDLKMASLRRSLGEPLLTAFHSPNAGYVFISAQGIFVERHLGFVPIRDAKFGYGSRQLVIAINHGRPREETEYFPINVPPGVSGEPLELFCASVNALPGAPTR